MGAAPAGATPAGACQKTLHLRCKAPTRRRYQYRDSHLTRLAIALAGTATLHAAATELVAAPDWDVAAVQYGLLEHVQLGFDSVRDDPLWQDVADAAYGFADAMLARLLELVGPDTTVWVVSPNGVRPNAALTGVTPLRPTGLIAARGRWIEPGSVLPPARLVDVAPSLLARFGLVAETDGKVLSALAPGMTRRPIAVPPPPAPEPGVHVAALRALGYDDTPSADQLRTVELAEIARFLALGEALLGRGRVREAEAALLQARRDGPANLTVLRRLALCRLLLGDAAGCRQLGAELRQAAPHLGWADLLIAAGFALEGNAPAAWPHMAAAHDKGGNDPELLARLGGVALMLGEDGSAARHFNRALALDPDLAAAAHGQAMARELAARYDTALQPAAGKDVTPP